MGNPIDSIVGWVDPAAGLRRLQARRLLGIMASGYSEGGASKRKNSMKDWRWAGGSTKEDIEGPLPILRQRSRDLYMNSGVARAALNRIQTNVVGSGLRLHAAPDAEVLGLGREEAAAWGRAVEREWRLVAGGRWIDRAGLNTFEELEQLALLSWLQSGDVFVLLLEDEPSWACPYALRLQIIEADRVCTPSNRDQHTLIRDGVEIDGSGQVTAYHVRNGHPLAQSSGDAAANQFRRVPVHGALSGRRNILHLMVAERPEQYRGVPLLAPVIEGCKQLSRYSDAELMAAVVASLYTVFIKSKAPETPFGESRAEDADLTRSTDPEKDYSYNLGPGAIVALEPDEDINIANPGRPNAQFDAFIGAVSREIGAALNVPSELLLLQFTSSYSASRAALLEAWKGFRMWRAWLANDFCQPVYEEWLTEAVLRGRVQAPGYFEDPLLRMAWCNAEWHGPSPGQIDPVKEVTAAKIRVEEGFSTRSRETAELTGGDFEANLAERTEEERMRRAAGLAIDGPAPDTAQDADEEDAENDRQ